MVDTFSKSVMVRMRPQMWEALRRDAKLRGVSAQWLIRQTIEFYLSSPEEKKGEIITPRPRSEDE